MRRFWRRWATRVLPRPAATVAVLALFGLGVGPAEAVRTRFLRTEGYEDFKKCDLDGVALTDDGMARLAPKAERLAAPDARTIWALASDAKGRIVFSTGDQGKVYAYNPRATEGTLEDLAELFDYELFALTSDLKGNLYTAGAPAGTVVRIGADGKARTFFDLPEGAVLALLAGEDGSLYVAAGDRGRLYRVSSDGEGRVLCESADLNLRSLAWSKTGRLWAGTDGRGLVEEIDPASGKIRVLYDAAEEEIVALLPLPDGGLIFGANPGAGPGTPVGGGKDSGSGGVRGGEPSGGPPGTGGEAMDRETPGPSQNGPRPAVYRLSPNGSVRLLWRCPMELLHALALEKDGSVLAATGGDAAVFRIDSRGDETLLWKPEEEQVLSFLVVGDAVYAGTGSPGRLYRLGPGLSREGLLTSKVLDARDQSRWGGLRWDGEGPKGSLSFETRSGFTNPPDLSWNEWEPVREGPEGFMVGSPPARFLQWRARFGSGGETANLRRIQVAYVGVNDSPRISALRVTPDDPSYVSGDPARGGVTQLLPGGIQIDYSLPGGGGVTILAEDVPTWIRRIRSITWNAQDPNGDDLSYELEIRSLGQKEFRVLAKNVTDRAWSFETGALPDGVYEIRLTASDAASNPPGTELTDAKLTPPFHVDTVAPVVTGLTARLEGGDRVRISGAAADESSPLRRIEAGVDGGAPRALSPKDGLMDGQREDFEGIVPLEEGQEGNWIAVSVQDEAGNRGIYRVWLAK